MLCSMLADANEQPSIIAFRVVLICIIIFVLAALRTLVLVALRIFVLVALRSFVLTPGFGHLLKVLCRRLAIKSQWHDLKLQHCRRSTCILQVQFTLEALGEEFCANEGSSAQKIIGITSQGIHIIDAASNCIMSQKVHDLSVMVPVHTRKSIKCHGFNPGFRLSLNLADAVGIGHTPGLCVLSLQASGAFYCESHVPGPAQCPLRQCTRRVF
mmetsp:Transcript_9648/g.18535  ORF Transcript_9648/g.18535 Transcript_9648/m.18535 type:complete len:213 (-) Transcript_9648:425-1063(-)